MALAKAAIYVSVPKRIRKRVWKVRRYVRKGAANAHVDSALQ